MNESESGDDNALRRRGPAGAIKPIPPPLPPPYGKLPAHLQAGGKTARHLPAGCLALDGLQPAVTARDTAQNAVALERQRNDGPLVPPFQAAA